MELLNIPCLILVKFMTLDQIFDKYWKVFLRLRRIYTVFLVIRIENVETPSLAHFLGDFIFVFQVIL